MQKTTTLPPIIMPVPTLLRGSKGKFTETAQTHFGRQFSIPSTRTLQRLSHYSFGDEHSFSAKSQVLRNLWTFIKPRKVTCKIPDHSLVLEKHGNFELGMNVYLPDNHQEGDLHPAVVLIHGSAFLFGTKDCYHNRIVADELTKYGIAVVSIDYRKIPQTHKFFQRSHWKNWLSGNLKHAVRDTTTSIDWLTQNGQTIGVNPQKLALSGFSAGGLIGSLAAFHRQDNIRGLINFYGPSDLFMMSGLLGVLTRFAMYGINFSHDEAQNHVVLKNLYQGPAFFIQGEKDTLVRPEQTYKHILWRKTQGLETYLNLEPEAGHGFMNDPAQESPTTSRNLAYMRQFLEMIFTRK